MAMREYPTQSGTLVSMARVCMCLDGCACAHANGVHGPRWLRMCTRKRVPKDLMHHQSPRCHREFKTTYNMSPQDRNALNKLDLRTDRQTPSIHALNKLHPTQPPIARVVSYKYVPVVTDTVRISRVIIADISYYIYDILTPVLAMR